MSNPTVTIGIPAFNSRPDYFAIALESFLSQDFRDFELVISDDGSNPAAAGLYDAAARADSRVRVIHHSSNRGHPWNFSHLVSEARGQYFLLGSDDDIRHPAFLSKAVELLESHPSAVGVSSEVLLVTSDNEPIQPVQVSRLMASSATTMRIRALLSGSVHFDYYGLFRTTSLGRTSIREERLHGLWGIETVVLFELLLQGPVLRADGCELRYRMKSDWNKSSLAAYLIEQGLGEGHPLYSQEARRSQVLRRALLSHPMALTEKVRACLVLERVLRSAVFTSERRSLARYAFSSSVKRGAYAAAAMAAVRYLYYSPTALTRGAAWKSFRRGYTIHPE